MKLYERHNTLDLYGPILWYLIHVFSFGDFNAFSKYMYTLKNLIPCPICKNHYNENLKKYPYEKYTKNNFKFLWTYLIHNQVNLLKNEKSPEYNEMFMKYKNCYEGMDYQIIDKILYSFFTLSVGLTNTNQMLNFQTFVTTTYILINEKSEAGLKVKNLFKNVFLKYCVLDPKSSDEFFVWSYNIYKNINETLNKPTYTFRKLHTFFY